MCWDQMIDAELPAAAPKIAQAHVPLAPQPAPLSVPAPQPEPVLVGA